MNPLPLFLIIVSLPLLLGGCGEKSSSKGLESASEESSDTPNSLSDADVERLLKEAVDLGSLEERDGGGLKTVYYQNNEPYSGWAKTMSDSEYGKGLTQFKDGKISGLYTTWYENGQKKDELTCKDGQLDGLWTRWYENGQKSSEETYKDGKSDGPHTSWHENGQKAAEGTSKDGKAVDGSEKYWNSKGEEVETEAEALHE